MEDGRFGGDLIIVGRVAPSFPEAFRFQNLLSPGVEKPCVAHDVGDMLRVPPARRVRVAAALIGVGIVLVTRCIDPEEAWRAIDGSVLVLIFSMLGGRQRAGGDWIGRARRRHHFAFGSARCRR